MRFAELRGVTVAEWSAALEALLPEMHEVDRDATRVWSAFYPLALADAFDAAEDPQLIVRRLRIDGNPRLGEGQVDSSHRFLYGHRYWPTVKAAVLARLTEEAAAASPSLIETIQEVSADVAARTRGERRLVTGITFVGLMTLRQVGLNAFRDAGGAQTPVSFGPDRAADAVVARRSRDDGQGALGFLRSTKRFSVVFDEAVGDARFSILDSQHLTTASANDRRNYMHGPRRFQEGPIPAQCRSATCGTCWVGVLGGREKLSEVEPFEARKLREFGYADVTESHPCIRLACQARAAGNITIVIPPWHGFVSRLQAPETP